MALDHTHVPDGGERAIPGRQLDPTGRRGFLKWSGAAAATALLAGCDGSPSEPSAAVALGQDAVQAAGGGVQIDLNTDLGILNFAFALEQLEAAFYTQVIGDFYAGATDEEMRFLRDIKRHEVVHREFFQTALGDAGIPGLAVNFAAADFGSRESVLETARAFEDLGVGAYNGAAQFLHDADFAPDMLRLLLENHERFLGFVERRVGSRDEAEDILQEAFVRTIGRSGALESAESATAWFYRVLRNALIDYYRREGSRARAFHQLAAEIGAGTVEPDEELEAVACACVTAIVNTLKPEYGTALRRVDLDGLSADEAGITPGNAGVRLHRAREALRRQLARSCGTCLTHRCLDCSCGETATGGTAAGQV